MRKKGFFCIIFALLLALAISVPAQAAPSVQLDGKTLDTDTPPLLENGRILVPMRAIFEGLGAGVVWDGATNTVTAAKGDMEIKLVIGGAAYKNGNEVTLDVPAKLHNGRTMVPLRFVSEALGASVEWDGASQTAIITSGTTPVEVPVETPAEPEEEAETPVEEAPEEETEQPEQEQPDTAQEELTPFEMYLNSLPDRFQPEKAEGVNRVYQFVITEGHPGKYVVEIKDGTCTTREGTASSPDVTITVGEQLWLDIAQGKVDGTMAYFTGKMKIDGNPYYVQDLSNFFQSAE